MATGRSGSLNIRKECRLRAARESELMANPPQVETVTTGADKAKLAAAVLLLVGALVAYYGAVQARPSGCSGAR